MVHDRLGGRLAAVALVADAEGGRGVEVAVVEDAREVGAGRVGEHGPEPGGIDDPAGEVAALAADAGELLGEAGRGRGPGLEVVVAVKE